MDRFKSLDLLPLTFWHEYLDMPVFFFFKTIHGLVSGEPSFIPKARITRPTTSSSSGVRALVKLRISNHKLMIEIGRYNQTAKDNRHCPFCGCNVIEDKVCFLFQCPTSSMIKNKSYYKVKTLIPNITQLPINILINELMNSSNYFINIQFIKYISACFDVRGKLLNY